MFIPTRRNAFGGVIFAALSDNGEDGASQPSSAFIARIFLGFDPADRRVMPERGNPWHLERRLADLAKSLFLGFERGNRLRCNRRQARRD